MSKTNPSFTLCLLHVVTVTKSLSHTVALGISQGDELEAVSLPHPPLFPSSPTLKDHVPNIPLLQTKMYLLIFILLDVYSSTTKTQMNFII